MLLFLQVSEIWAVGAWFHTPLSLTKFTPGPTKAAHIGRSIVKGSSWYLPKTVAKVGISHCPKKGGGDFAGQKLARNEDTAGILSIVDHDTRDSNVCRVFARCL